uniref:Uncharacterized protein n=1 Tax=Avena sativa TaxID=4498 RepID=A0ACD5YPW5_AVESA
MGEAKVKVEALLLVVIVLASSVAPSSSGCIPRRLLMAGYGRQPCREERIPRTKPSASDDGDAGPGQEMAGSWNPRVPPAPLPRPRPSMDASRTIPGTNN